VFFYDLSDARGQLNTSGWNTQQKKVIYAAILLKNLVRDSSYSPTDIVRTQDSAL
jgi:hypothetical protein